MRLIDADSINDFRIDFSSYKEGPDEDDVKAWLDNQPSIEAEPVRHRTWVIKTHDDGYGAYQVKHCPDCDRGLPVEYDAEYCPKCGAKMDGKGEEE